MEVFCSIIVQPADQQDKHSQTGLELTGFMNEFLDSSKSCSVLFCHYFRSFITCIVFTIQWFFIFWGNHQTTKLCAVSITSLFIELTVGSVVVQQQYSLSLPLPLSLFDILHILSAYWQTNTSDKPLWII